MCVENAVRQGFKVIMLAVVAMICSSCAGHGLLLEHYCGQLIWDSNNNDAAKWEYYERKIRAEAKEAPENRIAAILLDKRFAHNESIADILIGSLKEGHSEASTKALFKVSGAGAFWYVRTKAMRVIEDRLAAEMTDALLDRLLPYRACFPVTWDGCDDQEGRDEFSVVAARCLSKIGSKDGIDVLYEKSRDATESETRGEAWRSLADIIEDPTFPRPVAQSDPKQLDEWWSKNSKNLCWDSKKAKFVVQEAPGK